MGRTKAKDLNYGWTAGGQRGVAHHGLIARGGFSEVHKVYTIVEF